MIKKINLVAAFAALSVFLTACGANKTTANTETTQTTSSLNSDTFIYAIDGDPTSTNPITSSDRWGLTYVNMIFSPLVRVNGDGTYENVLADSVSVSEDGLTVTVKLKENLKWSDGESLDADDVVFTYNTKAKKENGNFSDLWINDNQIEFEKIDDLTVNFKLPSVSAAAINNVATLTYIMPEHVYSTVADFSVNELEISPVGSGPYKLKEYKRGEYIAFEANENYYDGIANIKNVIFRIINNADTRKLALQTGEVDASFVLPSEIADLDSSKINTYAYSENRVGYLGLNTATEALKDVKVRQAILYALNKVEMNTAAYISEEYYQLPYSILPPNNAFYTSDVEKYEQNIEKAKELLAEANVSGLTLNLAFNASDTAQTLQATLIQQQLSQIGITVELAGGEGSAIFAELRKEGSTFYNMFLGGYIMGNDPDQYKALFTTGARANYFQYKNDATDKLFEDGAVELDETKRKEIYNNLQNELSKQAFIYPIVDNKKVLAVNNRIENIDAAGLIPIYTMKDMSKLKIK